MKVSFDFDGCINRNDVKEYAKELIDRGIDVYICTNRFPNGITIKHTSNDDLYKILEELDINDDKVIFTSFESKCDFLKDQGFIWHLDDDDIDLSFISEKTDVHAIPLFNNRKWKEDCEFLLSNKSITLNDSDFINFTFKDYENNEQEVCISIDKIKELLEDELYEILTTPSCTSSSCMVNNFCECSPINEEMEISKVSAIIKREK